MIYLDANIIVYSIINHNKIGNKSREILTKISRGEIKGSTSVLTWDEVVYILGKIIGADKSTEEGSKLLNFPNLIFLNSDKKTIDLAQKILEKYNIRPRDAIHAATALINNVSEIISDDGDFDNIKEIKRIKIENFKQ